MIEPNSSLARDLKAAEEFFELARTASSPFMRAYYQRIAERYLLSEGEVRLSTRNAETAATIVAGKRSSGAALVEKTSNLIHY
jgi:hypothetical protein